MIYSSSNSVIILLKRYTFTEEWKKNRRLIRSNYENKICTYRRNKYYYFQLWLYIGSAVWEYIYYHAISWRFIYFWVIWSPISFVISFFKHKKMLIFDSLSCQFFKNLFRNFCCLQNLYVFANYFSSDLQMFFNLYLSMYDKIEGFLLKTCQKSSTQFFTE